MNEIIKCPKCKVIIDFHMPILCEECFHVEFQRVTGKKPEWTFNEKTQEFEEVYRGIAFKHD